MKLTFTALSVLAAFLLFSCQKKEDEPQGQSARPPQQNQADVDDPPASAGHPAIEMPHRMKPVIDRKEISIEPVEGGITIGELFTNRDAYADKMVRIRGQVTKVNRAILGKNWVHLQDGTSGSGSYDLTVTTQEEVSVGDVVTFEGTIVLKKDFGAGYAYDVLMEEAKRQAQ